MIEMLFEMDSIQVPVGIVVAFCHGVADTGANRHLHPLQCIHDQVAQFPVEAIEGDDVRQRGAFNKTVIGVSSALKRAHVGTETKQADDFQQRSRSFIVSNDKAAILEQLKLLVYSQRRFFERPHACLQAIKNPRDLSIPTEVGIGLAGVLLAI